MRGDFEFVKMHGAGNDFIMIEDMDAGFDASPGLVASLCAQHTGIGSDGLILLRPSKTADFRMRYFNRDGGEAEMCGNGARCAALFAYSCEVAGERMKFETKAGEITAEILEDGVRIGMTDVRGYLQSVKLVDTSGEVAFALSGVPHAAAVDDTGTGWPDERFISFARAVRHDGAFSPAGTNFNLVRVTGPHEISYRTFERGVEAETLACGTGAVAVAVIASKAGLTSSPVDCRTRGGDILRIEFELDEKGARKCFLSGPAKVSFSGSFSLDEYVS